MINILLYGLAGIGTLVAGIVGVVILVTIYDRVIVLVSSKAKIAKERDEYKKMLYGPYDD